VKHTWGGRRVALSRKKQTKRERLSRVGMTQGGFIGDREGGVEKKGREMASDEKINKVSRRR